MQESGHVDRRTGCERILVCLSSSPSNKHVVRVAARMAAAFAGDFTALYVQTPASDRMPAADHRRLEEHAHLAQDLGADVTTVFGTDVDDISDQIVEFARLSGVTKVVVGQSGRRHLWREPTLTERLAQLAPNLEIHILPTTGSDVKAGAGGSRLTRQLIPAVKDLLLTAGILGVVTLIGFAFLALGLTESNIITVYIFGVLVTSLVTRGYACSVIGSFLSVTLFNYLFTEPRMTFHANDPGYPVTFAIMLAASILTGTLAAKLKDHAKLSARAAFRTKVLFDTNQLLQKARDDNDIINITASQLMKLLNRDIIVYPETNGSLSKAYQFTLAPGAENEVFLTDEEQAVAQWAYVHKRRAGATTRTMSHARCLYLAIRINQKVYGVVGIDIHGKPLEPFEKSVLLSILGECALAIENSRNAREKEQAAVLAKNEQLRANLLRAISHDLRTPLTSISGNASNLLYNNDRLDPETRQQIFTDLYDDAQWLIGIVENLLSVTRLEEGRMNFTLSPQLVQEVMEEALRHVNRKGAEHTITMECQDELLLAQMDVRLILQVLVNLVDNAIKYTPAGSHIQVKGFRQGDMAAICVADDGPGIPDELKPKVFEMFFTGNQKIADSRRSLGLGLALCKSIVEAHGGAITLVDNVPHGAVFTFTLPLGEVDLHE